MTDNILEHLYEIIQNRREKGEAATSYVAKMVMRGRKKIAQKVGEEAVETVIEAAAGKPDKVIAESADLLFHLVLLWAEMGITPKQIADELKAREKISGIEEKKNRKKG